MRTSDAFVFGWDFGRRFRVFVGPFEYFYDRSAFHLRKLIIERGIGKICKDFGIFEKFGRSSVLGDLLELELLPFFLASF